MNLDFQERVAVVTGAANGIGREVARALAAAGARVALWDKDEAVLDLAAAIPGSSGRIVDVTDRSAVDAAVSGAVADAGRIDILINNAGIVRDAQLVKIDASGSVVGGLSAADFEAVIAVNLRGVFHCAQAVAPHMIERRYGRIVTASSVVGLYGNFGQTNYVASKSGVIGMTKVWARELGKYGITANAIAPGFIATEMARGIPQKILDRMTDHTPVGRMGQPAEVAHAYLFLASERASFINGAVLSVDGGLVLGT